MSTGFRKTLIAVSIMAAAALALPASATTTSTLIEAHNLLTNGDGPYEYKASALFAYTTKTSTTGHLKITLTNAATQKIRGPAEGLTAFLFTLNGVTLKKTGSTANLGSTSTIDHYQNATSGTSLNYQKTNIGSEFARAGMFAEGGSALTAPFLFNGGPLVTKTFEYGVSSSGLGLFGAADRFITTTNLDDPIEPDGPNYSIVDQNEDYSLANSTMKTLPMVRYQMVFDFDTSCTNGFKWSDSVVKTFLFQYGTSTTSDFSIPEPAFCQMFVLLGLGGMTLVRGRRRREAQPAF